MVSETKTSKKGFFSSLISHLRRNRLGDLLIDSGRITEQQLGAALQEQKKTGTALGHLLQEQGLITSGDLRATLAQQIAWRGLAACCAFVIGFSALGVHSARATSATANTDNIVNARSAPVQKASLNRQYVPQTKRSSPSLFGSSEVRSADISPFTKWTTITRRLNGTTAPLPSALQSASNKDLMGKLNAVNAHYNKIRYIEDKNNYGKSDYWATPKEFASRGGDCEDFAIAKYAALRAMGVPEDKLRLAIVQDTWKGIPHAVLIAYTDQGAMLLDNQYKTVKQIAGFDRYRAIYSINRTGWWRHTG